MKQIDDVVYRIVTRRGFTDEFWARLRASNLSGEPRTQEEIFDELNDLYEEEFGEPRFPSFSAFRKARDRRRR